MEQLTGVCQRDTHLLWQLRREARIGSHHEFLLDWLIAGGQVVIFSARDGIDDHRWSRAAPLFAPLNTSLSPAALCLFLVLASTVAEEGGFPSWLTDLLLKQRVAGAKLIPSCSVQ